MATRIKPVRINSVNIPNIGDGPIYTNDNDFQWETNVGDMQYTDFRWTLKQGNVTIENLRTYTTPTSNFTVTAGTGLKEGQVYVLRVNQGTTVYNITLGTGVSNPNGLGLTMLPNRINMLEFVAVSSLHLEFQGVVTSYVDLTSNQTITGLKTYSVLPQSSTTPMDTKDLTPKGYVDTRVATTADESTATDNTVLYIITQ